MVHLQVLAQSTLLTVVMKNCSLMLRFFCSQWESMLNWICSTECWQSHSYRVHLFQGKTADSAGKDGGKKKSKGAEDPGSRTEVGDSETSSSWSSLPLFFLKIIFGARSLAIVHHTAKYILLQTRAAISCDANLSWTSRTNFWKKKKKRRWTRLDLPCIIIFDSLV